MDDTSYLGYLGNHRHFYMQHKCQYYFHLKMNDFDEKLQNWVLKHPNESKHF
jgi:hypothetical protein